MRLAGKTALVTGGGQGIGAAICHRFAAEGATVIVADNNAETGAAVAREIGGSARFQRLDVGSEADWDAAFDALRRGPGRLDVLVNNAAIDIAADIESMQMENWRRTFTINVDGILFGMKRAIDLMKSGGGGSIVNISSIASMVSSPTNTAYSSSKAAVVGLSRTVALHCAARRYGIRVNTIHPGPIRTPMVMKYATENPQFLAMMQGAIPMGEMGDPMDIANGALYLASDESKWVTGTSLVIDGGFTAQ